MRRRHLRNAPPVWVAMMMAGALLSGPLLQGQSAPFSAEDQQNFRAAMEAANRGDAATAQPLLIGLHARHPDNFAINESLGLIYAGENNLEAALPLMAAAAAEEPSSPAASANLGMACLKLGRNADAKRALERAVQLNPGDSRAQQALGEAYMELRQPARAADAFERALESDENNPTLLYDAALARFDDGGANQAAALLARMPGVESSPAAQSLYGDVDEKLGHFKEAGQHYINAARLEPTEANEYVVGVEFLRHWTFHPAAQEFRAALQQYPESRRLRAGLGVAYFGDHNYSEAIAVFSGLLAADPDNVTYADLLGRSCSVLTEGSDAHCAALTAFAQEHPEDGRIATDAAIGLLDREGGPPQLEEAERLLRTALRAEPDLPEAHYEMGILLQRRNRWKASVAELQTAIRLKANYAAAHYRLALALARTGQRDRARAEIALQQKYSAQENLDRDRRLSQMQTLLVTMR